MPHAGWPGASPTRAPIDQTLSRDRDLIAMREALRPAPRPCRPESPASSAFASSSWAACSAQPDGFFPEGDIEKQYDAAKVADPILKAIHAEEAKRESELTRGS